MYGDEKEMTKRWVNRSSNSITMVNRAGAHRRENKRSPDKGGPGALLSCVHDRRSFVLIR